MVEESIRRVKEKFWGPDPLREDMREVVDWYIADGGPCGCDVCKDARRAKCAKILAYLETE